MSEKPCGSPRPHDEHMWQEPDPEQVVDFSEPIPTETTVRFVSWVCKGNRYWLPMERS